MKIGKVIITQKEKEAVEKYLNTDPCSCFECGLFDCDKCPFNKIVDELEDVRYRFGKIIVEEVEVVPND